MKKRLFGLLITLAMIISLSGTLPVMAWEHGESGTYTWLIGAENPSDIIATFIPSDPKNGRSKGELIIEGTGEMEDFSSGNIPWIWYLEQTTSVEISEGITSIGDHSFDCGYLFTNYYGGVSNLKSVKLPSTLTSIGEEVFDSCTSLTSIELPNSLTIIDSHAFYGCTGLTDITIPDRVTEIGYAAFDYCTNLTTVTIPDLNITYLGPNIFGYYDDDRNKNLTVYCYAGGQVEEYLKKYDINYVTIGQSTHIINKSELEKTIADSKAIDTSEYTDESVKILEDAIFCGQQVYESPSSTQLEVDNAVQSIKEAIENLVKIKPSEPQSNPSKPSDFESPSNPSSDKSSNSSLADPKQPSSTAPTSAVPVTKTNTTIPKATKNIRVVKAAKDKENANKAMNQAKLTKLTVKSKAKKKITVSWKKVSKAKGYEVQVSKNRKFKKSKIVITKTVKGKKITIKNIKIKSKKTYYVRVRAFSTYKDANNVTQKVYSKWNKKLRKVKVK